MKTLIIGASGQLGQTLFKTCPFEGDIIECNRKDIDLAKPLAIYDFIINIKPDHIINAAAYTAVDMAEKESDLAFKINSEAPYFMTIASEKIDSKLIHISTDFVFDGNKNTPYKTKDFVNPIGIYGKSKAKGEQYVLQSDKAKTIRTSWLYGNIGENFCMTMLRLHKERSESGNPICVVEDQISSPTSTYSLSKVCWKLLTTSLNFKTIPPLLHWCDSGVASWYDFAVAVGEIGIEIGLISKMAKVRPIKSTEFKTLVRRPHFSKLDSSETTKFLNIEQNYWRKELYETMKKINFG